MKRLERLILASITLAFSAPVFAGGSYEELVEINAGIIDLGEADVIDGVPDLSDDAIAERREQLGELREDLRTFDVETWSVARKVDYLLVWSKLNEVLFEHRVMQPWKKDSLYYLYQFSRVPYAEAPATAEEHEALRLELEAVPRIVDQAIENLTDPVGELARLALFHLENFDGVGQGEPYRDNPPDGTIGWFSDLCGRLEAEEAGLAAECGEATDAAVRYRDWLAGNLDSMNTPAAIGIESLNWYLRHVRLLPFDVEDLRRIGEREFHRFRYFYIVDRNKNADLPELELTQSAEQHRQRTRAAEEKIRTFLKEQDLLTIPDYMPDQFETDVFWSPRARTDRHFWEEIQFRNALDNHAHASIPGHRFDALTWERLDNPIRRTHRESARIEGWATYWEELLVQAGITKDNPRARELFYAALIKRGSRFFAEIGMHTGELTLAEANEYMIKWVPYMEEDLGRYDLANYLRRPGLGSMYLLGKTQIEQLISERAFELGSEFDLGEFHDRFLTYGPIPVTLIRWQMTGAEDGIRTVWPDVVGRPFQGSGSE